MTSGARRRSTVLATVLATALAAAPALATVLTSASGCGERANQAEQSKPHPLVTRLTIPDPDQHWAAAGFVEMVPPARLPTSTADADDVAIWLKIPDGATIETRPREGGGWTLVFPPGTIADRVEQRGRGTRRGVIDVRGTRIGDDGEEWMHTYRRGASAELFGYEWPRSQPAAHADATARLLEELARVPPGAGMTPDARQAYLRRIETKNQCVGCHVHDRPDNRREGERGVVNRGTDGSGFFTPRTVLFDTVPLETYGDVDRNLHDPWIDIRCPDEQPAAREKRGKRLRAACPDEAVPLARFDLRKALAHGDQRAQKLCRGRRYLHDHLDDRGKEIFADALAACTGPE